MKLTSLLSSLFILVFLSLATAQSVQPQTNQQVQPQQAVNQAVVVTQSPLETQWFGVSTGFPLGLNFHYGLDEIIQDIDLRFNGTLIAGSMNPLQMVLGIGADGLYNLDNQDNPDLDIYLGAGLGTIVFLGAVNGGFGIDIHGLAGAEYRFGEYGVFGEVNVGTGFASSYGLGAALRIGFNYHFQ